MGNNLPLVSVVALCYNHERFVKETLNSILQQSYQNTELIIIDDASKDHSVSVIENWVKEENIECRFIKHTQNKGICKTLNESLEYVSGRYYKVIACDDILLPAALEELVTVMEILTPEYAMVYADVLTINEHSEVFGKTPFEERGWMSDELVPSGKLFVELAKLCFIPAPSVLIRTAVIKQLKFDESLHFEDWDLWLRTAKQYLIKGITKPVVKYRIHGSSMFQDKSAAYLDAELRTVEKHIGFDKEADRYLEDFLYRNSIQNYMRNGINQRHWLWKRFLLKKTAKNFLHVILALTKITYNQKEKGRLSKWSKQ